MIGESRNMHVQTKRYLNRYREACAELESLAEEHDRIIGSLYSITSDPSRDGGGGAKDKIGDGVAALIDHCAKIDEEVKHYIAVRDEVKSLVREVMHRNILCGQCLHYRYVMRWKPSTVALEMGYDESRERAIHRKALEIAEELLKRREMAESHPLSPAQKVL